MQLPDRLVYLFERYMQKTYTPEELDELMDYIQDEQYTEAIRELIDRGWQLPLPPYEQTPQKANAIFNRIVEPLAVPVKKRRAVKRLWPLAAAAAMVLLFAGMATYRYLHRQPAGAALATTRHTPPSADHQYITLPDGSKVLLNAGSQLHYPDSFGAVREVHLTGEAYFDIRHNSAQPFIVYAGNTKTVVLGTAFNIQAFPGENKVVVTVTRGKVRVEHDRQLAGILTRNEQLSVDKTHDAVKKEIVNAQEAIAWKQDDMVWDDVPMKEVIGELQQRFNTTIAFSKPQLGNCRITAAFLHHEPLQQVIQVISRIYHMEYHIESNNSILLTGAGCE
jgi:ferric-dicitrate binding protein FerR (iron transport regulator)